MSSNHLGFTANELRKLRSLKDPHGIQRFIDEMPYHLADTAWSPRRVLQERTSHCLEGAIFAAAALRANGRAPLIFDLEAEGDTAHVENQRCTSIGPQCGGRENCSLQA